MNRLFLCIASLLIGFGFFSGTVSASVNYTPAAHIYLTGSSPEARFDVARAIVDSGSTASAPYLDTTLMTFSGTFYLSGAGWVEFDAVHMDCGSQSLSSLTSACTLSGTALSEMVGDIVFDGVQQKIQYLPDSGTLSGSITSYIGDFSLSGVRLPLRPVVFTDMSGTGIVSHTTHFTINDPDFYRSTLSDFSTTFRLQGTSESEMYASSDIVADLTVASAYEVTIQDPNGSTTKFDYTAFAGVPSMTLVDNTFIKTVCSHLPTSLYCPDGATIAPSKLDKSGTNPIADGVQKYSFSLKLRDQYGNRVDTGNVRIEYVSTLKKNQVAPENSTYPFSLPGDALQGDLENYLDGTPYLDQSLDGTDIAYDIASIAPTNSDNTLKLSHIFYTPPGGTPTDFASASDRAELTFAPWITTSLSKGTEDIVVGSSHEFLITTTNNSSAFPGDLKKTIGLFVGDNLTASYEDLASDPAATCTKGSEEGGADECNWSSMAGKDFPSVIVTQADSFSGTYIPKIRDPDLETVSYQSYVSYTVGGEMVIYPSTSAPLCSSQYDTSLVKILGQNNVGKQYGGIASENNAEKWNQIHEKIAKMMRNRTMYADVDYDIRTGNTNIDATSFTSGSPKKRTIIVIGGDITISSDIAKQDHPLALIALAKDGAGGNIIIAPSVKNIALSLFAEHAIQSSGDNQLSILGSLVSRNTMGETLAQICPFFVTNSCDASTAKLYDLEKIREGYAKLSDKSGHTATLGRATDFPHTAVIIEYDGRVMRDPPPGF